MTHPVSILLATNQEQRDAKKSNKKKRMIIKHENHICFLWRNEKHLLSTEHPQRQHLNYFSSQFKKQSFVYISCGPNTDGSVEEATRNGDRRIYISLNDGTTIQQAILTGKFCSSSSAINSRAGQIFSLVDATKPAVR